MNEHRQIFLLAPIFFQSLIYVITFILFKTFGRFEVRGLENVSSITSGSIFAANHSSEWDGILIRVALPFFSSVHSPMYYVSMLKQEYSNSGFRQFFYGGLLFKLLGAYPRFSGHKDYAYSLQYHLSILHKKRNLTIFPEGKRTERGEINKAHGGVAFLSHKTNTPVVPVAITGLVNFSIKDFLLFRKKVVVTFGKPIEPLTLVPQTNPTVDDYKKGAQYIMDRVVSMLQNPNV